PEEYCLGIFGRVWESRLKRNVARCRPALLVVLGVLAVGAALAAPRQFSRAADPLEGVKTAIRLKKFAEAATALQKLASAGNADAQYMLAVFYLNGGNGPRDALWLAATDGDVPSLEILADPALVSARDEFGRGALARAAEAGSAPAVTLLIRRGAAVDAADEHGMTPLMLAARAGELAAVEALLAAHPKIDAADRNRNTVLMHAAMSGRLAVVDRLLAAGASVAPRDVQDWSALDFAEVRGAADIVARLREKGATALHRSAIVSES